jgi:hypothetical protein
MGIMLHKSTYAHKGMPIEFLVVVSSASFLTIDHVSLAYDSQCNGPIGS